MKVAQRTREDQEPAELDPLRECAGDQGGGDDGEHELVDHERLVGNRGGIIRVGLEADTVETDPRQIADQAVHIRSKGDAVAPEDPLDADHGHQDETLHDGSQDVMLADHAPIEQGQAGGRHHENQGGRSEHPRRIATVDLGLRRGRRGGHRGRDCRRHNPAGRRRRRRLLRRGRRGHQPERRQCQAESQQPKRSVVRHGVCLRNRADRQVRRGVTSGRQA